MIKYLRPYQTVTNIAKLLYLIIDHPNLKTALLYHRMGIMVNSMAWNHRNQDI